MAKYQHNKPETKKSKNLCQKQQIIAAKILSCRDIWGLEYEFISQDVIK
jgi:hypothetical protein